VVSNMHVPGQGVHNVLFIATEHNSVYAFDADSNAGPNGGLLWHVNLGPSMPTDIIGCGDLWPEAGITGTPVINPATNTIYLVATTYVNGVFADSLHALDIRTGAEKAGSPVQLQASVPGIGDGSSGGMVTFDAQHHFNRPGLLLLNGSVYVACGSHCDFTPYHGWVFGYDAGSLAFQSLFVTTPNGLTDPSGYPIGGGGVWMSGCGPAGRGTSIYFMVGNGTFDADPSLGGGVDYGDSIVKLTASKTALKVADFFTPADELSLDDTDADLGSGGLLLLPDGVGNTAHRQLLIGAGKEGTIYLVDRNNMGHFNTSGSDTQIVQSLPYAIGGAWSSPAFFFNDPTGVNDHGVPTGTLYYNGTGDALKAFSIGSATISASPVSEAPYAYGYPGATPSVSASGSSKGVVWTMEYSGSGAAVLHAYDASNVATELYNSAQAPARDGLDGAVKFGVPTVANGKVYVGTLDSVAVFGSGWWAAPPAYSPGAGVFTSPVTVSLSDSTPNSTIYYTTDGSQPTTSSPVYTAPFQVSACTIVNALATASYWQPSPVSQAFYEIDGPVGNGNGLQGAYFNNTSLSGKPILRIDPEINFNWNGGSPLNGIGGDNWSAQWTGSIQPRCSTLYTISTISDDGVRVWINNQEIINDWTNHAPTLDSGTISLTAGQKYPITIQYFQGGGGSMLQLFWAPVNNNTQIVPQSQLYSGGIVP
ncbi:MAG TPA: PA14 domain-containing protein, partial [Chthonomonadales bacterium]|nr:PA14 domain-containing protein [Chthonomonadales bacterium]